MSRFYVPDIRWPDDIPPPPYRALARLEQLVGEGEAVLAELERAGTHSPEIVRLLSLQNRALVELGRIGSAQLASPT